jgi:hypothetical protein
MTPEDKANLRALAEVATPGPWMHLFGDRLVYDRMEDGCRGLPIVGVDLGYPGKNDRANLDYVSAANPATVLALLDEIDRLRAEVEALRADAGRYRELRNNLDLPYIHVWHTKREQDLRGEDLDAAIDAALKEPTK